MTRYELNSAGYRPYQPNKDMGDRWSVAYQKRIYRGEKTDYFINVHIYYEDKSRPYPEGREIFIVINDGCAFFPTTSALMIQIYSGCRDWTVEQMEACCAEMAKRLEILPYEK